MVKIKLIALRMTYLAGVGDDVLDIFRAVHLGRRVRALRGEVGEAGNLEGEALTVDDVPMELVELKKTRKCLPYVR